MAYVEYCCANGQGGIGTLEHSCLRCNPEYHPFRGKYHREGRSWRPEWGTRLKGFFPEQRPEFQLPFHDDYHCLEDLEAAGLVEIVSLVNGFVRLTDRGIQVASALGAHKARGAGMPILSLRRCKGT